MRAFIVKERFRIPIKNGWKRQLIIGARGRHHGILTGERFQLITAEKRTRLGQTTCSRKQTIWINRAGDILLGSSYLDEDEAHAFARADGWVSTEAMIKEGMRRLLPFDGLVIYWEKPLEAVV